MGTRKDFFYKNVIIDEADKARAELYLASKGVEKHIILKECKLSNSQYQLLFSNIKLIDIENRLK